MFNVTFILSHPVQLGRLQLAALDIDWIMLDSLGLWKTANATVLRRLSAMVKVSAGDLLGQKRSVSWHREL